MFCTIRLQVVPHMQIDLLRLVPCTFEILPMVIGRTAAAQGNRYRVDPTTWTPNLVPLRIRTRNKTRVLRVHEGPQTLVN